MQENTIGALVESYLVTKDNHHTQTWYLKYLRPMAAFLGHERELESVTRRDAEEYWKHLRSRRVCWEEHPTRPAVKRELSITTLHNTLRAIRTFWTEMVRQRLVDFNPFDHIKARRDSRPMQMQAINPGDLRAIWQVAKESSARDYALITTLATTGIRAGELVSMSTDRIDLKIGTAWVNGKRGWRKVFLGEECTEAIFIYMRDRKGLKHSDLWLSKQGNALSADSVRAIVDKLAEKAGVDGRHNLHSFRHRAAQSWLDNGINAEIVSQALGHADVNVTLLIYGNQDERRVRAAMRQVELLPFSDPAT